MRVHRTVTITKAPRTEAQWGKVFDCFLCDGDDGVLDTVRYNPTATGPLPLSPDKVVTHEGVTIYQHHTRVGNRPVVESYRLLADPTVAYVVLEGATTLKGRSEVYRVAIKLSQSVRQ